MPSHVSKKKFKTRTTRRTKRSNRKSKSKGFFQTKRATALPKPATAIQRGNVLFPATYMCRLRYAENFFISANGTTSVSAAGYYYRTNSVYDPRADAGGAQPLEYDIMAALYQRVWVHGAKITITFTNPEADGMYCGYRVSSDTDTVATTGQTIDYLQTLQWTRLAPINNTGSQTKSFSVYIPNNQVFGVTKAQFQNFEYSHLTNANPGRSALITPFAFHTIAETKSIRCNIKITYYCQFTNRVNSSES